jgi:oligopeptide transport system substrate-binding protein
LIVVNGKEPESLDPAIMTAQADIRIGLALFEGLTRNDPVTAETTPGLAERWDVSPDRRTYVFHLRADARWSTGEPITAFDFDYSWRRVLAAETGCDYAGVLFYVKHAEALASGTLPAGERVGFRALDERRFEVELVDPTPFFLDICTLPALAALPRQSIEKHGDRWLLVPPVPTSGAYALVDWRLNDRVKLRRNPHYWDAASVALERIDLLSVANPNTALNLYQSGAADITWDKEMVPTELLDALRGRPDFHAFDYFGTYFIRFNTTRAPLADPRVRQAFALAIDKARIVSRITRGGEKPAHHHVPPGLPGYRSPDGLGHDPDRARRLLAEAGFPQGRGFPRIEYLVDTHRDQQKIAVELQEMWRRELGVPVDLRALEYKTFLPAQSRLEYDLCRSSWIGDYNDPNTFLDMFLSGNPNNRTGWRNARYDALLQRANAATDPARRAQLLREVERILVEEEVPIAPLYFYTGFNLWDPQRWAGIHNNLRDEHPLRAIRKLSH